MNSPYPAMDRILITVPGVKKMLRKWLGNQQGNQTKWKPSSDSESVCKWTSAYVGKIIPAVT